MPQVDPADPFASFDPFNAKQKANGSLAVSTAPDTTGKDPFANFDPFKGSTEESKSSTLGAFARGAIGGAAPGIGSLPAIGAGAEAGAVVAGLPGAIVGGIAGGYFGSQGIATAQNWLLNKVPRIRDLLGQGEEQKRHDEEEHPISSFLGGIAPFAVTMSPGAVLRNLPENATTWQRLSANPLTARLFSGGIMGGMQAGQEAISEDKVNWTRVAVATGFGMVFNKPNRIGEAVSEYGAKPARVLLGVPHPSRPPTLAEVSEQNVAGPGVTESTFMGSEQRNPAAEGAAQHTAGVEESLIGPIRRPDLELTARKTEPELFTEYDNLLARRQTFKNWIDSQNEPKPFQFLELEERRAALENELAEHAAARGGYDRGPRARQIKAQIREIDTEHAALTERGEAFKTGTAVETPDIVIARKHLVDTDVALRDLQPRIQAAYRSAAEYTGAPTVPPPEVAAPPAETATAPPAGATVAAPAGAVTQRAAGPYDEQKAFIAKDFADQMIAAGRPPEEATLAGQLLAARIGSRASRFGGALGTPVDIYKNYGPKVIGENVAEGGAAPATAPKLAELPLNPTKEDLRAFLAAGGKIKASTFSQGALGSIRFQGGTRPIITMLRDADASTIIHELGHGWLEELMSDSKHQSAPNSIRDDAGAVIKWLGLDSVEALSERTQKGNPTAKSTRAHERFATGFEQYLREGKAPSPELANVFARFKAWLLDLYKTIKGLGKEISPEIRSVFDRMLTEEPQQTVIGPERLGGPTLADIHEGDAKATDAHEGEPALDRVVAERDRYAEEQPPNIKAELEGAEKQIVGEGAEPTGEGATGGGGSQQVVGGGGEPEPITTGGGGGEEPGKIVEGGTNARPESPIIPGAGARPGSPTEREHPLAPGPAPDTLPRGESRTVDLAGNIRVENLTNVPDIAQAIHESAERNDDFHAVRGDPMSKGMMWDLASDMGMNPDELDEHGLRTHLEKLLGGMRDMAPKVLAARRLEKQSASIVADLSKRAAQSGSDEDTAAFALAVTRHDMIQSALSGGTASWGRTGSAFHDISEGWETTTNVNALLMSKTGRTLFQMKQLAKLMSEYDTTGQISKLVRDSGKKSFGRMATEYWINGLISGIQTHVTYSVGNTILAMEKMGPETLAAAGIGELRKMLGREGETVRLGEVIAGLKGVREGFWGAVQSGLMAARSGVTTLLPGEEASKTRRFQPPLSPGSNLVKEAVLNEAATFQDAVSTAYSIMRGTRDAILAGAALQRAGGVAGAPVFGWEYSPLGAIPNFQIRGVTTVPLGEIARAPSRMIAAIHSFFRPLNYSIDINQRAYRAAANENLTGTDFDAKVAALRQSPTPDMMEGAHNAATELTLMGAGGAFTKKLSGLVNTEFFGSKDSEGKHIPGSGLPILKFIDPFVHISSNIINQSIVQRTPFGILSAQVRADLLGHNGNIAADTAAARMLAGTALSLMFGGLAAEGYITGSEPKDRQEAAVWRQVYQAHSVKIGDVWYDMHRLGPMGMLLSTAADLYEVAHMADRGEFTKAAAHLQHAVTQNILDESFMRGPSDLIKAVEDPARYGEAYIKNFISSFIPFSVAMSQMARASDPYSRDARTVVDAIKSKVPGLSQSLMPRRDVWGEILPSRESLGPPGITAIWEQKVNDDPVNKALLELGIHPAAVGRKIRNVELTDEQHDDWARLAGRLAKLRMNAIVQSGTFQNLPPAIKHDLIVEQLRQSREVARNMLFIKFPSLLVDAQAAKMQKRMGPQ